VRLQNKDKGAAICSQARFPDPYSFIHYFCTFSCTFSFLLIEMINYFRSKFFSGESIKAKKQLKYEQEEKKKNTLNEVQILEGHQDIVRLLTIIDNAR
jgi:hypothetical protein